MGIVKQCEAIHFMAGKGHKLSVLLLLQTPAADSTLEGTLQAFLLFHTSRGEQKRMQLLSGLMKAQAVTPFWSGSAALTANFCRTDTDKFPELVCLQIATLQKPNPRPVPIHVLQSLSISQPGSRACKCFTHATFILLLDAALFWPSGIIGRSKRSTRLKPLRLSSLMLAQYSCQVKQHGDGLRPYEASSNSMMQVFSTNITSRT